MSEGRRIGPIENESGGLYVGRDETGPYWYLHDQYECYYFDLTTELYDALNKYQDEIDKKRKEAKNE